MELNKIIRKIVNDKISEIHTCLPAKIESYDPQKMRAKVTLLAKKELEGKLVNIPPIVEVPVALLKAGPFVIRQPFQKGDPILVVFGEKAIDKLLITGNPEDPQFKRQHSFDDAIIIGGLQLEQDPDLPGEELDSLYFSNLDYNNKIVMRKNGDIRIVNEGGSAEEPNPAVYSEIIIKEDADDIEINRVNGDSGLDVGIKIKEDGNMIISDNTNGTELKFDVVNELGKGAGSVVFSLAEKLLLGSANASEGIPLGNSLKNWLDSHKHSSTGSPPITSSPDPSKKVLVE